MSAIPLPRALQARSAASVVLAMAALALAACRPAPELSGGSPEASPDARAQARAGEPAESPAPGPPQAPAADVPAPAPEAPVLPPPPPVEVDPALRGPLDPADWVPLVAYAGRPVDVLRELDPAGKRVMRIHTVLALGPTDPPLPSTARTGHGPDWRYFDSGFPARVEHWLEGALHGPFEAWWPTGQPRERGHYDRGARVGPWERRTREGKVVEEGLWVAGQRQGVHRSWFADGQLEEEAQYTLGVLDGPRRRFSRHGKLLLDERYVTGVLDGPWADHYPESGALRSFGKYERGQKVGPWRTAREDAQGLLLDEHYVAGALHGLQRRFGPDGTPVAELTFEGGLQTGPSRSWYPDGTPQSAGRFEAGRRVGPWTYWSPDGGVNERWTGTYADDARVGDLGSEPAAVEKQP